MPSILTTVLILLGTASLGLAGLMDPQPPDYILCDYPIMYNPPFYMFPPWCLDAPVGSVVPTTLRIPSTGMLLLLVLATTILSTTFVMAGGPAESQSPITTEPETLVAIIESGDDTQLSSRHFRRSSNLDPLRLIRGLILAWIPTGPPAKSAASAVLKTPPMILLLLAVFATTALGSTVFPRPGVIEAQAITYSYTYVPSLEPRSNDQVSAATPRCGLDCDTPGPPKSYPSTHISSTTKILALPTATTTTTVGRLLTLILPESTTKPVPESTVTQTVIATHTQPGSTVVTTRTVRPSPKTVIQSQRGTVTPEISTRMVTHTKAGSTVVATRTVSMPPKTITETLQRNITSLVTRTVTQSTTIVKHGSQQYLDRSPTTTSTDMAMMLPSPPQPTESRDADNERLPFDIDIHEVLNGMASLSERYLQRGVDQIAKVIDIGVDKNPHPVFELLGETAKSWIQNTEDLVGGTLMDFPDLIFGKPHDTTL